MEKYTYDVFLSWTGADRQLKNDLKEFLISKGIQSDKIYDSDINCRGGEFRQDYISALSASKVYIMILSDSVLNDPNVTNKGVYSEVCKEGNYAYQLEQEGRINIIILNLSNKFIGTPRFEDFADNDIIGRHFFALLPGKTKIDAKYDENGNLDQAKKDQVYENSVYFIQARDAGTPIPSVAPKISIAKDNGFTEDYKFFGRGEDISRIKEEFSQGKRIVVVYGLGGMGKTSLATEFARICNDEHSLLCPQIVHIQDNIELVHKESAVSHSRQPNYWIDTSVRFVDSVIDSVKYLSPSDMHTKKLNAIASLPENVLLILDNFNDIQLVDIKEMLNQFRCKILITTRLDLEYISDKQIANPIKISELPKDVAYEMFKNRTNGQLEVSFEEFGRLYEHVKGHTITLCIIAKLLAQKPMQIKDLLDDVLNLDKLKDKLRFEHNENVELNTVYGHLASLFNCGDLSDDAKYVLKNLCLLNNGSILLSNLKDVLNDEMLSNGFVFENALTELKSFGWVESQGQRAAETIVIHPIVSELVANMLSPTFEETLKMQDYLADVQEFDSSFEAVNLLQDRAYFAVYRLARATGKLCRSLWELFVENNHRLGDVESTQNKLDTLSKHLSGMEKEEVLRYKTLITVEYRPGEVALLQDLAEGCTGDENYKWLLRVLSVTLGDFIKNPQYSEQLLSILEISIDLAIEQKDDLSIIELFKYYYILSASTRSMYNKLKRYLSLRKKEMGATGTLLFFEHILTVSQWFSSKELIRGDVGSALTNTIKRRSIKPMLKILVKHPIGLIKMSRLINKFKSLPLDDKMLFWGDNLLNIYNTFVEENKLDLNIVVDMIIKLYNVRRVHGITLSKIEGEIGSTLSMFGGLPSYAIKQLNFLNTNDRCAEFSFDYMRDMYIGATLSVLCEDYEQSLGYYSNLLQVVEALHSKQHPDYVYVLMAAGNAYYMTKNNEIALNYYLEAYNILKITEPKSEKMGEVCINLLNIYAQLFEQAKQVPPKFVFNFVNRIKNDGVECYGKTAYEHYLIFEKYLNFSKLYSKNDEIIENVLNEIEKECDGLKQLEYNSVYALSNALLDFGIGLARLRKESVHRVENCLKTIRKHCGLTSKKLVKICIARLINFISYYFSNDESNIELCKFTIKLCVKSKMYEGFALAALCDILCAVCRKYGDDISSQTFATSIISSKKLAAHLASHLNACLSAGMKSVELLNKIKSAILAILNASNGNHDRAECKRIFMTSKQVDNYCYKILEYALEKVKNPKLILNKVFKNNK